MDSNLVSKLETPFLVDFSANIAVGDHKMRGMYENGVFPKKKSPVEKATKGKCYKRKLSVETIISVLTPPPSTSRKFFWYLSVSHIRNLLTT